MFVAQRNYTVLLRFQRRRDSGKVCFYIPTNKYTSYTNHIAVENGITKEEYNRGT